MLSNKEVQIGSSMARIFAFAIVPSFLIQAFALTSSGYDATWGPVLSVLNVVTGFALLFVFALTTKLYGDDNSGFSFNFWTSHDAAHAASDVIADVVQDAVTNLIKEAPQELTGECNVWKNYVDFPVGKL